jgi:hypothetical protein
VHQRRGDGAVELLQVVYVCEAHPGLGLLKGEAGTIVALLEQPYFAYLVEFMDDGGATKAETAFIPSR